MTENIDQNIFPPGWECKFDRRTGKHYYINYLTKMTSWEDPRIRQKAQQIYNAQPYGLDYVPQLPGHASPYLVYPYPSPLPPQHAFQPPPYPTTYSPKALPKQILQEMGGRSNGSPLSGGSPVLGRTLSLTPKGSPVISRIAYNAVSAMRPHDSPVSRVYSTGYSKPHDSPITLAADTDSLVAKISSMFPTVSDTHIKILLKKYYNREAVVISALQVEKHPISTPGPFSTPPAGLSRLAGVAAAALSGGSLGGSPRASPPLRPLSGASGTCAGSPRARPHTSPKMKLRYLKSVFPKAEETLILDVLAGEDNNVLRSSDRLLGMGYLKRDTAAPRLSLTSKEPEPPKPPPTPPRLKSIEEKQALKLKLQQKYSTIPERVVSIALESVDWSEERAEQILAVVLQEDAVKSHNEKEKEKENEIIVEIKEDIPSCNKVAALSAPSPVQAPPALFSDALSLWRPSRETTLGEKNRRHKAKKEVTNTNRGGCKVKGDNNPALNDFSRINSSPPSEDRSHQSKYLTAPKGANSTLAKGAQDQLLLVDYVTWNGANPELKSGPTIVAKGSLKSLSDGHGESYTSLPRGSNKDICKGPPGLAKGSMYQHINKNKIPQMKVGGE